MNLYPMNRAELAIPTAEPIMNPDTNYPPAVKLPSELSDEAAAALLEFLYELARTLENTYADQLHRYYHPYNERQLDIWDEHEPPC